MPNTINQDVWERQQRARDALAQNGDRLLKEMRVGTDFVLVALIGRIAERMGSMERLLEVVADAAIANVQGGTPT